MGLGCLWNRDNKHKYYSLLVALKLRKWCPICLENKFVGKMFKVDGCSHTYCYSCMKRCVDIYISAKRIPKCPDIRCDTKLIDNNIDRYKKFLPLTTMVKLEQMKQEAKLITPKPEKIHCPHPKCFAKMSLDEALKENRGVDGNYGKCISCKQHFCVHCRAPWHSNMTCVEYRRLNPTAELDAQFNALVSKMSWCKCPKCTQTIELVSNCPHILCRCGMEFCYKCGFEYEAGRSQCGCLPLFERDWELELIYNIK